MLKPNRLAAAFHSAIVVSFADPGEVGIEQIVTDQREEPTGALAPCSSDLAHRGCDRRMQGGSGGSSSGPSSGIQVVAAQTMGTFMGLQLKIATVAQDQMIPPDYVHWSARRARHTR
jgi:hypothetical protein